MSRKHQAVILIIAAVLLFGGGYKLAAVKSATSIEPGGTFVEASGEEKNSSTENIKKEEEKIIVHVAGAVKSPGVYELSPEARIIDAVNAAGPSGEACLDMLNLAAPLQDGIKIVVLSEEDYQKAVEEDSSMPGDLSSDGYSTGISAGTGGNDLVNINNAGSSRLEELNGIGPSLAGRIIGYREKNGRFLSVEDIKNVSGIGEKRYEDIKDHITVN